MEKVAKGEEEEEDASNQRINYPMTIYSGYKEMINQCHNSVGELPMVGDIYGKTP